MTCEGSDATGSERPRPDPLHSETNHSKTTHPDTTHEEWDRHTVVRETVEADTAGERVSLAYYRRPSAGPPLVCVHGLTAWGPDLFDLALALGEYDVVVADVRGHGRSDAPGSGYDLDTAAADLRAVIEDAGVRRPVLLGHSLGGGIVTTYAARYPARAVVAIDPVGMLGGGRDDDSGDRSGEVDDDPHEWVRDSITASRQALRDGDHDNVAPGAAYAHHRVRRFGAGVTADPTERYERIDVPVLVLRADVPATDRTADKSRLAALTDHRVVYVDDAGHTVHRDRPERTASLVRSFLAAHG